MEKERSRILISTLFIILGLITCYPTATASAQDQCTEWVAKMESPLGVVQVRRAGDTKWTSAKPNETYCPGDTVRTLGNSSAALRLPNEAYDRLDQKTTVTFNGIEKDRTSLLDLIAGAFHFFSRTPRALKVTTPFVNGTVEGTEFFVRVAQDHTLISVFQGNVLAANDVGNLNLASGQSAIAYAGEAPKAHIVARPRDAVQWAIYYPAVIDYKPTDFPGEEAWQGMVRTSIQHYRDGNLPAAFSSLDGVPETIPDPRFYTYRAGLLLTVGRVEEASEDIEKSLDTDPENSHAFALRSIIAVAQNRKDEALELAARAVTLDPNSSDAKVAFSYAQQANFQIQAALETLQEAVELSPENALAWARLSELWMSVDDLDKALEAAQKGADLNPNLARTQTVLGFAYLAQIKTKNAKAAFEQAIALDQAAPLPRLGLGLVKIREGDLESGRADIEMAVCLDPNNSLMRSYLGKAFFDEKRDKHSDNQFALAKELDPKDPTPYFYDAIRKQTLNRPVEALRDLQKSIELNDNRAVYRSRLLLDEDLAARSASLGRIYNDLGFQQLALVEGWKSVNTDPSSYSAHRFLADSYAALPGHGIARVSELLQSQLLQPISITPVQPHLAEGSLFLLEGAGPTDLSFNEFNPLFLRNRLALQVSGVVGENDILSEEVVNSWVWGRISYSIGQFHHQTDGFRENNDQEVDLYSIFAQIALSHKTSIQTEYRYRETDTGDLPLLFDLEGFARFMETLRDKRKTESIRIGFRHSFGPKSDLLASCIYFLGDDIDSYFAPGMEIEMEEDGYMIEAQHLFRSESFNLIGGIGHISTDRKDEYSWMPFPIDSYVHHTNLYLYTLINYPESVNWTLGVSADFYEDKLSDLDVEQFNPKIGLIWEPFPGTTLRAAAFKILRRTLISNQTLEPTQVAGFNQFFYYDANGAEVWRYGLGIDQRLSSQVYAGFEFSKRDLQELAQPPPLYTTQEFDSEEYLHRAYVYWMPHSWIALGPEYLYERIERPLEFTKEERVTKLTTHRASFAINFFHPCGFSTRLKPTYISQDGEFEVGAIGPPPPFFYSMTGDDDFWILDASIGYRLPKRLGLIELEAKNLFNEEFKFQDTDPRDPQIYPERLIMLKFTLSF